MALCHMPVVVEELDKYKLLDYLLCTMRDLKLGHFLLLQGKTFNLLLHLRSFIQSRITTIIF